MRILVVGATGMLGHSIFKNLNDYPQLDVYGTVRNVLNKERFFEDSLDRLIQNVNVFEYLSVENSIKKVKPDVVINCVGLIKQHEVSKQHVDAVKVNALLPHKLAASCERNQAKLIHFSTDCVFDGKQGNYSEDDLPTARDLYGRSKCLGEVDHYPHLTLRTSIIGHELSSSVSLIDWFLSQKEEVKGFSKAIFSGLPTCSIAKLLAEKILPRQDLTGLYHLSVDPIDKYKLLSLVSEVYGPEITIKDSSDLVIDRSLDSSLLRGEIGFDAPSWEELIVQMHEDYLTRFKA